MNTLKPYLIRAINEWIVDNGCTPHILVDAETGESTLPMAFVQDGKIVLNIRPEAAQSLSLGNDKIEFNARFSGKPMHVVIPVEAILAIYAKENGKGMIFDHDEDGDFPPPSEKKPKLRVVK
ncbi:MAG: ClpXP protease specificity-enhancing factor [Gammaproteobacteria bacterium]